MGLPTGKCVVSFKILFFKFVFFPHGKSHSILNSDIASRLQMSQVCKIMRQSIDSMWTDFVIREEPMQTVFQTVKPADVKTFVQRWNAKDLTMLDISIFFGGRGRKNGSLEFMNGW